MKIAGDKVYIRFYEESDAEALCDLHLRNREFFQKYTPSRNDDYYTVKWQLENIRNCAEQMKEGRKYSFGIFAKDNDKLIGNVTLSEVLHDCLQGCFIGYYLDKESNGKGYMTEAVNLAVDFALNVLLLHRIEAGVMPHNTASMRVLEKAGFHKEGIAQKNVKINGRWEDHQVLAIVSEDH